MKKIFGKIIVCMISLTLPFVSVKNVYGEEKESSLNQKNHIKILGENKKIQSNIDMKEEGEYTNKVYEEEKKKYTGKIDKELEVSLNEFGILDEEIEDWSSESIKVLEEAEWINIVVEFGNNVDGTEVEKEEFFKEYYTKTYKGKSDEISFSKKILTSIGLIPIEVEASDDDYDESESKKFKQTLVSCSTKCNEKNEPRMFFMYEAIWKEVPVYNNKDYILLSFSNGELEKINYRMLYDIKFTPSYNDFEPYEAYCSDSGAYDKYVDYIGSTSFAVYAFDLPGDKNGIEYSKEIEGRYDYSNVRIKIEGYVVVWDSENMKVATNVYYNHYESALNISLSGISVNANGVSLGISVAKTKYYHLLGDVNTNITVAYIFK